MTEAEPSEHVSMLRQREIEARVIAPLIAEVHKELGEEKTHKLLERVVQRLARTDGQKFANATGDTSLKSFAQILNRWTEGGALELEVIEQSDEALSFNVTRCRYAELYRQLGIADLGSRLSCCRDAALAEGFSSEIRLKRTQTIMEGAPHCDFRFHQQR